MLFCGKAFTFSVSQDDAKKIADKIWRNECGRKIEGLTHWNIGENFASLGIGHFIWFPVGAKEKFKESFPELLQFFQKEGIKIPTWLKQKHACPWNSRDEFYGDIQNEKMIQLRQFLFDTRDLQAIFIAKRLEKALPKMGESLPKEKKEIVLSVFSRLANDPKGLYALIDYLNFKGEGTSPTETYQGEGWGLLQVLQQIPPTSNNILIDFVTAAKAILTKRVENSPVERHEERWLKGWHNRIDTYLEIL